MHKGFDLNDVIEGADRPLSPKKLSTERITRTGAESSGRSPAMQAVSELSKQVYTDKERNNITQTSLGKIIEGTHGQRDTSMEAFRRTFNIDVKKQGENVYKVDTRHKKGGGLFINQIDVANGIVYGISNYKYRTNEWHLSEILIHQMQLVKEELQISKIDLKEMRLMYIDNKDTLSLVNRFCPEKGSKKILSGTKEFMALKKTPLIKAVHYLLEQNQEIFYNKELKSITICREDEDITIQCEIGDRE